MKSLPLAQNEQKPLDPLKITLISYITAGLVMTLALLAFILSYSSLQHMAQSNGIGEWLSYLWPLLLDFAMIVFSLAILRANLRSERNLYPWLLTIIFASLAMAANILDVTDLGIPPVFIAASVKALAPASLVLAFELLMAMVKAEVRRAATVQSIDDLKRQATEAETETNRHRHRQADAEADAERLSDKIKSLKAEIKTLQAEKRKEKSGAPAETSDATKAAAAAILAERGDISGAELGRLLGRSESLGRRLKRELVPADGTNGSGTGSGAEQ